MLLAPMTTALRELEALLGPARAITKRDALLAYECDGFTIHRQSPLAVVFPESTAEVQSVLRILHRHRIPVVPRGAGTCLSGGPTPVSPAVVVDVDGTEFEVPLESVAKANLEWEMNAEDAKQH